MSQRWIVRTLPLLVAATLAVEAAFAHLRTMPLVKSDAIAVFGFSFGAMAAIRLGSASYRSTMRLDVRGLRALAMFYGSCDATSTNDVVRAAYQ
ncbi:MAG: hypothetical protein FJX65_19460 [Alphaproteobacteria bacterium]|nr:hypothetical protein [Alphaproteobacteria bacterium]